MAFAERTGSVAALRALVRFVPAACGIFCAFLSNIPVSITAGALPPPLLALVPVYYWCLVRPDLMTPATAFFIGIVEDVLAGGRPPGLWTLSFVLTYAAVARSRESFAGLSGLGAVLGFSVAAAVACASAYVITALFVWRLPLPGPIVSELAMTVLFYIPTAMAVGAIHHWLVGPLRSDM